LTSAATAAIDGHAAIADTPTASAAMSHAIDLFQRMKLLRKVDAGPERTIFPMDTRRTPFLAL
jgi:hypothetical protein